MKKLVRRKDSLGKMKQLCVLGVLKTDLGIKIKEEMLEWLVPLYDVTTVEVDPPNNVEFEYPFLKKACEASIDSEQPILYLHTKGAACNNQTQPLVRKLWRHEFSTMHDLYFDTVSKFSEAVAVAPFTSLANSICWFNGFVMNYAAAEQIDNKLRIAIDRYWYEQKLLNEARVNCIGMYHAACNTPECAYDVFINNLIIAQKHLIRDNALLSTK